MSSRDSELLHLITKILIQTIKKEIRCINIQIINSTEYENKNKKIHGVPLWTLETYKTKGDLALKKSNFPSAYW